MKSSIEAKFSSRFMPYARLLIAILLSTATSTAPAVTQYKTERLPFTFEVSQLRPSLKLDIRGVKEYLTLPEEKMLKRLKRAKTNETVEPLTVIVSNNQSQQRTLADKLARLGKEKELAKYFAAKWPEGEATKEGSNSKYVEIDDEGYHLIDRQAFGNFYGRFHHKLQIDTAKLHREPAKRKELLSQIQHFFDKDQRKAIARKAKHGEVLNLDTELLPDFAKKMVGRYIIYRGPNCFHAALAFHSPTMTSSSLLNVKEEEGYHRAMINYDELWRVLNSKFYEVDPAKAPLKYGDLLVYFDVPENLSADAPVDYRWIRHTAAYLFDDYAFSKGSKSPNTPYSVRTLNEEWDTWSKFTKKLGVKVFRRSEKRVRKQPPRELVDWIY